MSINILRTPEAIGSGYFHGHEVVILDVHDVSINGQVVDTDVTFTPVETWAERLAVFGAYEFKAGDRHQTSSENIHRMQVTR